MVLLSFHYPYNGTTILAMLGVPAVPPRLHQPLKTTQCFHNLDNEIIMIPLRSWLGTDHSDDNFDDKDDKKSIKKTKD